MPSFTATARATATAIDAALLAQTNDPLRRTDTLPQILFKVPTRESAPAPLRAAFQTGRDWTIGEAERALEGDPWAIAAFAFSALAKGALVLKAFKTAIGLGAASWGAFGAGQLEHRRGHGEIGANPATPENGEIDASVIMPPMWHRDP